MAKIVKAKDLKLGQRAVGYEGLGEVKARRWPGPAKLVGKELGKDGWYWLTWEPVNRKGAGWPNDFGSGSSPYPPNAPIVLA